MSATQIIFKMGQRYAVPPESQPRFQPLAQNSSRTIEPRFDGLGRGFKNHRRFGHAAFLPFAQHNRFAQIFGQFADGGANGGGAFGGQRLFARARACSPESCCRGFVPGSRFRLRARRSDAARASGNGCAPDWRRWCKARWKIFRSSGSWSARGRREQRFPAPDRWRRLRCPPSGKEIERPALRGVPSSR